MELIDVLSLSHDWAIDRIEQLDKEKRGNDALAIELEFYEWLDPNAPHHDVFSIEWIADD